MSLAITSSAFAPNAAIPSLYTCEGKDVSPPLAWSGVPAGTKSLWGRVIFYVLDVDALYERAIAQGLNPEAAPRNAEWGERFFHVLDPDGHELSFAKPLKN